MTTADLHRTQTVTRPVSSIACGVRLLYAITACLFVAGVILQVFLAGLGLMVDGDRLADHQAAGYLVIQIPYAMLLIALFARLPRGLLVATVLLALLATIHDVVVYMPADGDTGFLRAFHPVNALLLFWLGLTAARGALQLPRRSHHRHGQPRPNHDAAASPRGD